MAGDKSTVKVTFLGDATALAAASQKAQQSLDGVSKKSSAFGTAAKVAAAGAAIAIAKLGWSSVQAASDMNETLSKSSVLFGKTSKDVERFAETAAESFGQSKQQALDAATTFATFGKSAGLSGQGLVEFSTQFTGLASDMASFSNTSPQEAIEAIGSALRGEAEPIRKFGVLLDDATLRNEALKLGLIKTTKDALTPQQKVLAAQSAIYGQTSAAQGDFARTSDGLANKQRILSARLADMRAEAGARLLPAMLSITGALMKVADFVERNSKVIAPLVAITATLVAGIWLWTKAQAAINLLMTMNPIGIVVVALAALAAGMYVAYKRSETFRKIVDAAFRGIATAASFMWDTVLRPVFKLWLNTWLTVVGAIITGASKAFGWIGPLGDKLDAAKQEFDSFRDSVNASLDGIKDKQINVRLATGGAGTVVQGRGGKMLVDEGTIPKAKAKPRASRNGPRTVLPDIPPVTQSTEKEKKSKKKMVRSYTHVYDGLAVAVRSASKVSLESAKNIAERAANIAHRVLAPLDRAIDASKKRLEDLKQQSAQLRDMATSNARSFASILGFKAEEGQTSTAGDVLNSMRSRLEKVRQFAANLRQLAASGLNRDTYAEILGAGVEQGGSIAQTLAGNMQSIGELNSLQAQVNAASAQLGAAGSDFVFGDRIDAERSHLGRLQGLRQLVDRIDIHVAGSVISERDLATKVRDVIGDLVRNRGGDLSALGLA